MANKETYKIKDLSNGKIYNWTVSDILGEINRDRSGEWQDYDETDWKDGWDFWIETNTQEFYTMDLNKELVNLQEL